MKLDLDIHKSGVIVDAYTRDILEVAAEIRRTLRPNEELILPSIYGAGTRKLGRGQYRDTFWERCVKVRLSCIDSGHTSAKCETRFPIIEENAPYPIISFEEWNSKYGADKATSEESA